MVYHPVVYVFFFALGWTGVETNQIPPSFHGIGGSSHTKVGP